MLLIGVGWAALVSWLLLRVLRQASAFRTQALQPGPIHGDPPSVSVIIPARDEAANIGPCLDALGAQAYPPGRLSLIVVDDGSTDATAQVVQDHVAQDRAATTVLIEAGPLPPGWFGKPYACWRGAAMAKGDWLCFIDADVRAEPGLLAGAVATAEAENLDMLSVQPFQELGSFWEQLIVPSGMLMIACAKRTLSLGVQSKGEPAVNGQILLVRAASYRRVGGHAAVRAEVCEDAGLARRLQQQGYQVKVAAGEHVARVRMYRGFASLWEGFAKNAVDIVGGSLATLIAAVLGVLVAWAVLLVPIGLGWAAWHGGHPGAAAGCVLASLASCTVLGVQGGALRHFRAPLPLLLLMPAGVTLAAALAIWSVRLRGAGRVRWKGRTYAQQDYVR